MLVSTLDRLLLTSFQGDVDAMYEAITEISRERQNQDLVARVLAGKQGCDKRNHKLNAAPGNGGGFSLCLDPVDYAAPGTVANSPIYSYTRQHRSRDTENGEKSEN